MSHRVVITCGPSHTPIDAVRRITNFSTGEIGTLLSSALLNVGFDVLCFRGEGATYPEWPAAETRTFSTNDSLAQALRELPAPPLAIFHAAALCDFEVSSISCDQRVQKISSRDSEELGIWLRAAPKLLPRLKTWFPDAMVVGWKYELDESREVALQRGFAQIREAGCDLTVVNGSAYGKSFGVLNPAGNLCDLPTKAELADYLARWLHDARVPA